MSGNRSSAGRSPPFQRDARNQVLAKPRIKRNWYPCSEPASFQWQRSFVRGTCTFEGTVQQLNGYVPSSSRSLSKGRGHTALGVTWRGLAGSKHPSEVLGINNGWVPEYPKVGNTVRVSMDCLDDTFLFCCFPFNGIIIKTEAFQIWTMINEG